MVLSKIINYFLIVIGCIVAIYAQAGVDQNELVLVLGIVILMLGIYRISRNIPSKFDAVENEEHDEEE